MKLQIILIIILPCVMISINAIDQRIIEYFDTPKICEIIENDTLLKINCKKEVNLVMVKDYDLIASSINQSKNFTIRKKNLKNDINIIVIQKENNELEYHQIKINKSNTTKELDIQNCTIKTQNITKGIIKSDAETIEIELIKTKKQPQNAKIIGFWFTENNLKFFTESSIDLKECFDKINVKNPNYTEKLNLPIIIQSNTIEQNLILKTKINTNTSTCYFEQPINLTKGINEITINIICQKTDQYNLEYLIITGNKEYLITNKILNLETQKEEIQTTKIKNHKNRNISTQINNQTSDIITINKEIQVANPKVNYIENKPETTVNKNNKPIFSILIIFIILTIILFTRHKTQAHNVYKEKRRK
ncbi:hypothetical protein JXM83_01555 [Candidatus Woesearchaeota archaeon]|nr:hypothetical protein [Candidatus Woesearchaeota archaeon]